MTTGPQPGETVWLVDAHNLVHRLYHAVPPQVSPTGQHVNAVTGWIRSLRRLRKVDGARWVLPIFDAPGPCWRHEIFAEYKAGRPERDAELVSQWPLVVRSCFAMGLPALAAPGFEADDLIAAYVEALVGRGCSSIIVSQDKDLLQLVRGEDGEPGSVRQLAKGRDGFELRGPAEVEAKFGVGPELLGDLLALMGDKTDGVPGVRGVGEVTAAALLRTHGSLDEVLDRWALIPRKKVSDLIHAGDGDARMSRRLVGLRADAPLPGALDDLAPMKPSTRRLNALFGELGFVRWESAVDAYTRA